MRETIHKVAFASETILNVVALLACWGIAYHLYGSGRLSLSMAGHLPTMDLPSVMRTVVDPTTPGRFVHLGWALLSLAVAGVLALSASEGTWWMFRRLTRPVP